MGQCIKFNKVFKTVIPSIDLTIVLQVSELDLAVFDPINELLCLYVQFPLVLAIDLKRGLEKPYLP